MWGDKSSLKNHFHSHVSLFWLSLGSFDFFFFFNTPEDELYHCEQKNSDFLMRLFTIKTLLLTLMPRNWSVESRDCSLVQIPPRSRQGNKQCQARTAGNALLHTQTLCKEWGSPLKCWGLGHFSKDHMLEHPPWGHPAQSTPGDTERGGRGALPARAGGARWSRGAAGDLRRGDGSTAGGSAGAGCAVSPAEAS